MRRVDRDLVVIPPTLSVDLTSEIDAIRVTGKINNAIYGAADVRTSLTLLYKHKCYLCEADVKKNQEIEHFLPWSKVYPERGYDWNNLHLSCGECNSRKRSYSYKEFRPNSKIVDDILLLDPSSKAYNVEELIAYNKNRRAIPLETANLKCVKTAEFLNASDCQAARNDRWDELAELLFKLSKERGIWMEVLGITPYVFPADALEKQKIIEALEKADSIYKLFLMEDQPYSRCIKAVIFDYTSISHFNFKKLTGYSTQSEPPVLRQSEPVILRKVSHPCTGRLSV